MAVPKKKKSKSKTAIRKNAWKKSIVKTTKIALSLSRSLLKEKNNKFVLPPKFIK